VATSSGIGWRNAAELGGDFKRNNQSDRTNVLWTKCLWVEIDSPDKTISSEEKLKAAELLKNNFMSALYPYGIEPSYIVCSGHGFHSYFILKEVHHDTFLWSPIKEALITLAKGDHQAKDMTRLLRVPGTLNWKDKDNPIPVELVFESDRIYDEDDFKQLVKDHIPKQILNITPNETS